MNIKNLYLVIILFLSGCSSTKNFISVDDLSGDNILLLGLVEYDYSHLENKNVNGIIVSINSKEKNTEFKLPEKYLHNEKFKENQFINAFGNIGDYELCYYKLASNNTETDDLLELLDKGRRIEHSEKKIIRKYIIKDGKIVNLGKLIVKYEGGNIENKKIKYSFNLELYCNDTTALHAFRETYPLVYDKYKNDICETSKSIE